MTGPGDQHVVLEPDADSLVGKVDTGLHGDHETGLQRPRKTPLPLPHPHPLRLN